MSALRIVVCGLSITSSWGNGHATTYRALLREFAARGHDVLFLERDRYWYAENRDLPEPSYCRVGIYESLEELKQRFSAAVREADVVVVGSYVPDGVDVLEWVISQAHGAKVFYDIDTPVTLAKLSRRDEEYIAARLIPKLDLYLSFTGGPTLRFLENTYGARCARVLYCSVDPNMYYAEPSEIRWDLGYLGTYGADRQGTLERLLVDPARHWPQGSFVVAGPLYPDDLDWPANIERTDHLPPAVHRHFYNGQRFTLNVTRADMVRAGYSPSVRLFEAAACGTPIVSDYWEGLNDLFSIGAEILVATSSSECLGYLREMPEEARRAIGESGRRRVLASHTAAHRAAELEERLLDALASLRRRSGPLPVALSGGSKSLA